MTWIMGQAAPSTSFQQDWEKQFIHRTVGLPLRWALTGWKFGPTGTSGSSRKGNGKCCLCGATTSRTSTGWKVALQKTSVGPGVQIAEPKLEMCPQWQERPMASWAALGTTDQRRDSSPLFSTGETLLEHWVQCSTFQYKIDVSYRSESSKQPQRSLRD